MFIFFQLERNYIVFLMTTLVSGSFSLNCRIYALTTEILLHPSTCYTHKMITILLGLNLASKSLTIHITHLLWFPPSHKFYDLEMKGFPHFFAWWLHAVCPRWQLSRGGHPWLPTLKKFPSHPLSCLLDLITCAILITEFLSLFSNLPFTGIKILDFA